MKLIYLSVKRSITLALALFQATDVASAASFIGYGSSDAALTSKSQEAVYMGFEAGLNATTKKLIPKSWLVVEHSQNGSPAGARRVAKHLIDSGAAMLVGFPTSYDGLLAADVAQEAGVLAVFRGCHMDLAKKGPLVFTADATMERLVQENLDLIESVVGLRAMGLMISNPASPASVGMEEEYINIAAKPGHRVPQLDRVSLDRKLELSPSVLTKLKNSAYAYLYITAYPDESRALLQQLRDLSIDLPIIANPAWPSADIEYLRRLLVGRTSKTYSTARWLSSSPAGKKLTEIVRKKYGRDPTGEMAYGYDLGVVVGTLVNRIDGDLTKESVIKAFKSNRCFEGLSNGNICFSSQGGHAQAATAYLPAQFTTEWVAFTFKKSGS